MKDNSRTTPHVFDDTSSSVECSFLDEVHSPSYVIHSIHHDDIIHNNTHDDERIVCEMIGIVKDSEEMDDVRIRIEFDRISK